jgi:hypothetical protein
MNTGQKDQRDLDEIGCPVCGEMVRVAATYRTTSNGKKALVDFECNREGKCGVSEWDPCPMYVIYLERAQIS